MTFPTASQQPSRSYTTVPALESYQIPTSTYISQSASIRLAGVVGAAIIIHKDRVLLIQRAADDDCPDVWEIPGGELNGDESIIDGAVRELWEETGLQASKITAILGEFEWEDSRRGQWKIFIFQMIVEDSHKERLEITLDAKEHRAYLWATEDEIRSDLCADVKLEWISLNQKKAILMAFKNLNTLI